MPPKHRKKPCLAGTRIIIAGLAIWPALTAAAAADAWSECQSQDPGRMLAGCAQVMAEQRESPANMTTAYLRRWPTCDTPSSS
jgi:hypothetical protein